MKFGTEKIGKHSIEVEVNGAGKFSAEFNEKDYEAETIVALRQQLKKAVKVAERIKPVEVTVLGLVVKPDRESWDTEHYITGVGTVDAVLRGRHERNNVWMLTAVEGKQKFQIGGWGEDAESSSSATIVRRLDLAETLRYKGLVEAVRVAETALEDFIGSVKIDPADALAKAEKKAAN